MKNFTFGISLTPKCFNYELHLNSTVQVLHPKTVAQSVIPLGTGGEKYCVLNERLKGSKSWHLCGLGRIIVVFLLLIKPLLLCQI